MKCKQINILSVILFLVLFSGCGVKLDAEKKLTDLAKVSLKTEGDVIYCLIEPREEIPENHFIIFRCFRGDKLLWKSGYQVKHLALQFKDQKIWKCKVVSSRPSLKAGDVKKIRVSLSPYLPYS
ncbi:MAG: hypothetical protein KAS65_11550 [Candidatus Aminicenantes bacterium]|nr:hypothetical protein [Candidatus Aminicenantes bacterium]